MTALSQLAKCAFDEQDDYSDFNVWKENMMEKNINANYWFQVMELETILFSFIKSIREADFSHFLVCLKNIIPWMFALDHTHYARWISVFIKDLSHLDPPVYDAFQKGFFTVKRSKRDFSNMGVDQAHEQNNKMVKIHGGAIGILDNENALLRWAVSGPVVAEVCKVSKVTVDSEMSHHEDTTSFEVKFRKDVRSLLAAMNDFGNPFKEVNENLVHIASKIVLDDAAAISVRSAYKNGEEQYYKFAQDRLCSENASLYDIVRKNKLPLFKYG